MTLLCFSACEIEVCYLQTFRIAELGFCVTAPQKLEVGAKWAKFSDEQISPCLTYEVSYEPTLPEHDGVLVYQDRRVRVCQTEEGRCSVYSNIYTGTESASVLRLPMENGRLHHRITILQERLPWGTAVEQLFELYDLPHALVRFGKMLLHCAYILYEGRAILFTAPSGTGKTTQANFWKEHLNAQIINGDRAAVGVSDGVGTVYGLPFSGSSDDCENVQAPIAAIVSLSQAKENRVERLHGAEALRQLMRGAYVLPEHRDDLPVQTDVAAELLRCTPIYRLACLPQADAAYLLRDQLQKDHRFTVF